MKKTLCLNKASVLVGKEENTRTPKMLATDCGQSCEGRKQVAWYRGTGGGGELGGAFLKRGHLG